MWKELIEELWPECDLQKPCTKTKLTKAEKELGLKLPKELTEFFLESNGLFGSTGQNIIMPISRLVNWNLEFWNMDAQSTTRMPFSCLFFFGAEGNGDMLAYRIIQKKVDVYGVYEWDHETDGRKHFSSGDLRSYLLRSYLCHGGGEEEYDLDTHDRWMNYLKRQRKIERIEKKEKAAQSKRKKN